jgi:hypothetical protein
MQIVNILSQNVWSIPLIDRKNHKNLNLKRFRLKSEAILPRTAGKSVGGRHGGPEPVAGGGAALQQIHHSHAAHAKRSLKDKVIEHRLSNRPVAPR